MHSGIWGNKAHNTDLLYIVFCSLTFLQLQIILSSSYCSFASRLPSSKVNSRIIVEKNTGEKKLRDLA